MDDRLERTVETYENNAQQYAATNADRSNVATLVDLFLDALDGDRVLDVGCGPGWETAQMVEAGVDVVGVDISQSLLDEATEHVPHAEFARADMRSLPIGSESVDGVWACASLLHVPREQLPGALAELARVLRPDGLVVATVKSEAYDDRTDDYDGERHFEYYAVDEFRTHVEAAGFDVVELNHFERGWIRIQARAP